MLVVASCWGAPQAHYHYTPLMHSSVAAFSESYRSLVQVCSKEGNRCQGCIDHMNEIAFCEAAKIDANLQYVKDKKQEDYISNTASLVHALFEDIVKSKSLLGEFVPYANAVDNEIGGVAPYDPYLDAYNSAKYMPHVAGKTIAGGKMGELPLPLKLMSG
jgi:hypothetical protein